jgi:hypothetical protein
MPEQKKSRKFIRNDKLIRPECRVKKSQHNLELESFRQLFLSHCFPFLGLVPICQLRGFENIFETSHSLVDSFLCFYRATIKRHCSTQIDKSSRTLGEQNRWQNRPCVTFGPCCPLFTSINCQPNKTSSTTPSDVSIANRSAYVFRSAEIREFVNHNGHVSRHNCEYSVLFVAHFA